MPAPRARAFSVSAEFVDRAHIRITNVQLNDGDLSGSARKFGLDNINQWLREQIAGKILTDSDISDNTNEYRVGGCDGDIIIDTVSTEGVDRGQFSIAWRDLRLQNRNPNFSDGCFQPLAFDQNFNVNTANNEIWFNVVDNNNIRRVDGDGGNYTNNLPGTNDLNRYVRAGGGDTCPDGSKPYVAASGLFSSGTARATYESCDNIGLRSILVSGTATVPPGTPGAPGSTTAPAPPSCASEGGDLSYFICPGLKIIDGMMRWLYDTVQALLEISPAYFDRSNPSGAALYSTTMRIRNIAYLVVVPIMLVMVIGTALGFEFISAYTVKRALPRLVAAVIFITLCWQILVFIILFFNAMGNAAAGLTMAAFPGARDVTLSSIFNSNGFIDLAGTVVVGIAALTGFVTAGILLSFGVAILIALVMGFIILAFRQLFILLLLVLGPLAILAWIFPGNDKLWKLWWNSFFLMNAVGVLFLGADGLAKGFAVIIIRVGSIGTLPEGTTTLFAATVLVVPWALGRKILEKGGGMMLSVSGMAKNGLAGFQKKNQEWRGNMRKDAQERARTGVRFKQTPILRNLNTLAQGTAHARSAGFDPRQWRGRMSKALRDTSIEGREAMLKDESYTWKNNDNLNALAFLSRDANHLRELARQNGYNLTSDQLADVEAMRKKYGNSAFRQATWKRAAAGGTVFDRPEIFDENGNNIATDLNRMSVWQGAAFASGGNRAVLHDLVGGTRSELVNAGRGDEGGGGHGDTVGVAERFLTNPGYTSDQARADLTRRIYETQGASVMMHPSMKLSSVEQMAPRMAEDIQAGIAEGNQGNTVEAAANFAALAAVYENMNGTNKEKARVIRDRVMSQEIEVRTLSPQMQQMLAPAINIVDANGQVTGMNTRINYQQAVEALRSNSEFQQFRREYQTQIQAQQGPPPPGMGGPQTGAPTGVTTGMSDRRLKRNIQHLYTTPTGIDMYRFQYLWSDQTYVGVMAQDLVDSHPQALSVDDNGFYQVNYGLLGLQMLTYENWLTYQGTPHTPAEQYNLTH